jgi:catechol 2,3-dioxygenase-like lactoylglutathione lyase family enzyme
MRIREIILIVNDISVSQKFYERLGFKVDSGEEGTVVFKTDNPQQKLVVRKPLTRWEEPGKQIASFYKENVAGYFQKCKIMGVPFEKDLRDGQEGKEFAFRDPDGNRLEIYEKMQKKEAQKELEETPINATTEEQKEIN